jgi:hypothetical protein
MQKIIRQPRLARHDAAASSRHWAVTPQKVLASFNTWAFKREQPSDPAHLLAALARRIEMGAPVAFVLYWGKGPRPLAGLPERTSLAYLGSMLARIAAIYPPGGMLHLVFTDTHAALNGHAMADCERYLQSVRAESDGIPVEVHRLGAVVEKFATPCQGAGPLDEVLISRLERSAARWYRGAGDARTGAERYLAMNMIEKVAIERAFPDAVFITFNSSEFRQLFPDKLGIFYMYSLRKGVADKPWFLPDSP